jgi:hypothetical protein
MSSIEALEQQRLELQARLDGGKTPEERNRLGQFATPTALARDILRYGIDHLPPEEPIRFLDPGIGTGSFYSALCAVARPDRIAQAQGFEIDPHYGEPAAALWQGSALELRFEDFTQSQAPAGQGRPNLLICNPPYVRHHHLEPDAKVRLPLQTEQACGVRISGLSGLYCYFMGLAHPWMEPGAIAGWLIPSEFMGVNYGRMLKSYLLKKVTLLHIHRFDPTDVQFADALVSSAVVWIRNTPPRRDHQVRFTYGGSLAVPAVERLVLASELTHEPKWTRYPQADAASVRSEITLGDLFDVKRGLATGDNSFFVMDEAQIEARNLPMEMFRPLLPGSRHLPDDEIKADQRGRPVLDKQLFLLDPRLSEEELGQRYPVLKAYLDTGKAGEKPVAEGYLCRSRRPWYTQENRPPAPIICTYMGRSRAGGKPFRFILNHSQATALNTYLMLYPKPALSRFMQENPEALRTAWRFLNDIDTEELLGHGRVYGGGLHKLEPKELRGFPAHELIENLKGIGIAWQGSFFETRAVT